MAVLSSAASSSASATLTLTDWWLKSLSTPALNQAIDVEFPHQHEEQADEGEFHPFGRTRPIFVSDELQGEAGSVVVDCWTAAAYTALRTLIRTGGTSLLLQSPFGEQWYVHVKSRRTVLADGADTVVQRKVTLAYAEVDVP